eukprot:GFUD01121157.1.p1 GENE.GFUD01121157.1~~GFUD01121157.1.p1  ORF type:complete len:629 (+),score=106.41 GFUD01121157.1:42-1889(+)
MAQLITENCSDPIAIEKEENREITEDEHILLKKDENIQGSENNKNENLMHEENPEVAIYISAKDIDSFDVKQFFGSGDSIQFPFNETASEFKKQQQFSTDESILQQPMDKSKLQESTELELVEILEPKIEITELENLTVTNVKIIEGESPFNGNIDGNINTVVDESGIKNFQCNLCDYQAKKSHVKRHLLRIHFPVPKVMNTSDDEEMLEPKVEITEQGNPIVTFEDDSPFDDTIDGNIKTVVDENGKKNFQCNLCDYQAKKSHVKRHLSRVHFPVPKVMKTVEDEDMLEPKVEITEQGNPTVTNEIIFEEDSPFNDTMKTVVDDSGQKFSLCNLCNYKATKSHVKRHISNVHFPKVNKTIDEEEKNYKCDFCDYKSNQKNTIKVHTAHKHFGKPYPVSKRKERDYFCDQCEYKTNHSSHLKEHINWKHEGQLFNCDQCSFKTTRLRRLKDHEEQHSGLSFPCDTCPYQAPSQEILKRHVGRKHTLFICDQCTYQGTSNLNLKNHVRFEHEGIYMSCDLCEFKIQDIRGLKKHKRAEHEGFIPEKKRLFLCTQCDYKGKKDNLRRHVDANHLGVKYLCDLCDYRCGDPCNLMKHYRTKHDEARSIKSFHKTISVN